MTDGQPLAAGLPPPRVPESEARQAAIAEWEAQRHAIEVRYWAVHLDEFVARLPRIRRNRLGDARAAEMARDVIETVKAAHGADAARKARGRLRSPKP